MVAKHTFFSSAFETFSRTNHIMRHKTYLSKFKNTDIIPTIISDHNGMKQENQQYEKCEIYKYVEIKQHISK